MDSDTRYIATADLIEQADAPTGWMALGELARTLDPSAIHVLTSIAGLTANAAEERVLVVEARLRTLTDRSPIVRPLLVPAGVWATLPTIDRLVDLLSSAGELLALETAAVLGDGESTPS